MRAPRDDDRAGRARALGAGQLSAIAVALLAACGSKDPSPGQGSESARGSRPSGTIRPLARVQPNSTLLVGTRRVAVIADEGYFEPGTPPISRGNVSTELAKLRARFGTPELFLATHPIVVGGEEHHEKYVRLTPAPKEVELDGHLVRAIALPSGVDVWQVEEKLRAQLAIVDREGKVTALAPHTLAGPPPDPGSPVIAKQCEAPKIADLVAHGEAALALLVECHPDAPVRIATYRWPNPTPTLERLGTSKELGVSPVRLVAAGEHRALVGIANGALVIRRLGAGASATRTLTKVTRVMGAAMTDDGAVWTLTIDGDTWQVARDGVVQPTADAAGAPLKPAQLGFDHRHGIVVLAKNAGSTWLYSER